MHQPINLFAIIGSIVSRLFSFLLLLLPIYPLRFPPRRTFVRQSEMRIDPGRDLDPVTRDNLLLGDLVAEGEAASRMLDVRFGLGHADDLRPRAHTPSRSVVLAVIPQFQVDGRVGLFEQLVKFAGSGQADGVGGGADGFTGLKDDTRAWRSVPLSRSFAKIPCVIFVGGRGVVESIDTTVTVGIDAAVPNPHEVPFVSVRT